MTPMLQTILALGLVGLAAAWLGLSAWRRRGRSSCGDGCGAVSPEVKKLQARLKR